jgi:MFS family permease
VIPPLLREHAEFRRFWLAQTISNFGDQVSYIALPLVAVLVLHASPAEMGYLGAISLAPHLLLSLSVGVWLDRVAHRRRVMIAADLGRAALLSTVPIAYALDRLTLGQLYSVGFLHGALSVFFDLSYSTLFVSLVSRERFLDANSLLHGSRAFSYVAGPSVGGTIVQVLNGPIALLADAASFVGSALLLRRIETSEPPLEADAAGILARLTHGARFIARTPIYRASLAGVATINLFNFMFAALFILYATRELHVRPGTLGAVLGAGAIGGLLGSVVASRLGRRIGVGRAYIAGCVVFPASLLLVPLAGGPKPLVLAMLFVAEFLSGVGVMILDINGNSITTAITPDAIRARVVGSARFVNYGIRPIGMLLGGILGDAIGVRPTLWVATAGALVGLLWLLPSPILGLRELPEPAT